MKKQNIFWGIFFILAAVFILVSKLGIVPDIGITTVLATAFSLWLLVDGLRHLHFYNITFALAFLYIIFDAPLDIEIVSPWTALTAALFLGIGLSFLFGGKKGNIFPRKGNMIGKIKTADSAAEKAFIVKTALVPPYATLILMIFAMCK